MVRQEPNGEGVPGAEAVSQDREKGVAGFGLGHELSGGGDPIVPDLHNEVCERGGRVEVVAVVCPVEQSLVAERNDDLGSPVGESARFVQVPFGLPVGIVEHAHDRVGSREGVEVVGGSVSGVRTACHA